MNNLVKTALGLALLAMQQPAYSQFASQYSDADGILGDGGLHPLSADQPFDLLSDIDGDNKADSLSVFTDDSGIFGVPGCDYTAQSILGLIRR